MGSVLDPLVVVNKGAPRKNSKDTAKKTTDGHRIKSFHETQPIKCGTCGKGGHNRRRCPWRVSKFEYLCSNYAVYFCVVVVLILFLFVGSIKPQGIRCPFGLHRFSSFLFH